MAKRGAKPSAMDFLVDFMKKNPRAEYADAADAAKKAGLTVYPIMWGRAQVMLGRVKAKKRGTAKQAKKVAGGAAGGKRAARNGRRKRGPGRPPKSAAAKRGRPRKAASSAGGRIVLPVRDAADLALWQGLVEAANRGGGLALQFDGQHWVLVWA